MIRLLVPLLLLLAPAAATQPLTDNEPVVRMVLQEARGESLEGMIAVAGVAFDRVSDPRWPSTTHEVVYQPWQFTAMHYEMGQYTDWDLAMARRAVESARDGARPCGPGVFWYHTVSLKHPEKWPPMLTRCTIGNHVFFAETPRGSVRWLPTALYP